MAFSQETVITAEVNKHGATSIKTVQAVFNHKNFMNGLGNKNGFQSGNG